MATQINFFTTTLAQSLADGGSEPEVYVNSITTLDGETVTTADFAALGVGYLTIDPQSSQRVERVSFTTVDSAGIGFTGITRGLFNKGGGGASTVNAHYHPVGSPVIIAFGADEFADFLSVFVTTSASPTVAGIWTFTNPNYPRMDVSVPFPTDPEQLVTKDYADSLTFAGAPDASTSAKGIIQIPTQAEVDGKTATGSTGALLVTTPDTQRSTLLSDYTVDTGAADAYVIDPTPPISAYITGQQFTFKATNTNTTTSTLNVSSFGPKTIKKQDGATNLAPGDIQLGQIITVEYDGTNFQMLNPSGSIASTLALTFFGNGSDGNITIGVNTSLSRDMYYDNLTINNGFTLNPNGFRIFVAGTLNRVGTGKIASIGHTGGNAADSTPGVVGAAGIAATVAYSSGTLPIPLAGEAGGAGGNNAVGVGGAAGTGQAKSLGNQNAVTGGTGGTSAPVNNNIGGPGGTAGAKSGTLFAPPEAPVPAYNLFDLSGGSITQFGVAPSSGGGGGGGGEDVTNVGGSGGGSGSSGGVIWVAARIIGDLIASAKGGAGGNGGSGGNNFTKAAVGAGGSGGNGGVIIIIYQGLTGSISTDITGGAAGAPGVNGVTGGLTAANAGNVGLVYTIAGA
jgi:hypothetical protein